MVKNFPAIGPSLEPENKKECIEPPNIWRIFYAAISGVFGMFLVFVIWFIAMFLVPNLSNNILLINELAFLPPVVLFISMGATVSFFEWLVLRPWIPDKRKWFLVSTLAFIVLLLGGFVLLNGARIQDVEMVTGLHRSVRPYAESALFKLNMIIGGSVGIPFGLLLGAAQSFLFRNGRGRWWLASVIIWMIPWAVIGVIMLGHGS